MASSKAIVVRLELCLDGLLEEYFRQYFWYFSLSIFSLMYSLIFNSINSIFRSKVGRVFLLISYSVNIIMTKSVIFALHNNKPFSYRFLIIIKIYNCGNWIIRFICFSRISEMTRFTPEDKQVVDN